MPSRTNPAAAKEDYKPGNILDHLDQLTPSKGGKYHCPVCNGNDLSINKKSGATTCHNNGCEWKAIMDAIAPLDPKKNGRSPKNTHRDKFRPPSKKELDSQALQEEVEIDSQACEFASQVSSGSMSESEALLAMSTWCKAHKHSTYAAQKLLQEKIKRYKTAVAKDGGDYQDEEAKPRLLKEYELIKHRFGERLRYNELKKQVELDGVLFEPIMAKTQFAIFHKCNLNSGREDVSDLIVIIAKESTYSPVRDYLDNVSIKYGDDTSVLNDLARRSLGCDKPIHETALMRWLVSCVARAYSPGCKVDVALILQGKQGHQKSMFFNILASDDFFDDSVTNAGEKEEKLKLHRTWIVEWAELETVFKKKDVSVVKALMSSKIDILRPPYGRCYEEMKRPSVFAGTSNQDEFLADSTGNRRFWVIPVTKKINPIQLQAERDRIWAAAVTLYRAGVQWWLTDEEESVMSTSRTQFESSDSWAEEIESFCEGKEQVSITAILEKCLDIPKANHDRKHQARVKEILIKNGWNVLPNPVWSDGEKRRVWKRQVLPSI
jgi:predicted P-loop ATPase